MDPRFEFMGIWFVEQRLIERFGTAQWNRVLQALTVKEKPPPRAPIQKLRSLRIHYCFTRDGGGGILLPRRMAAILTRGDPHGTIITPRERDLLFSRPGFFGGKEINCRMLDEEFAMFAGKLYAYQEAYVNYVLENRLTPQKIQTGESQVYICLETGQGKTVVALSLIASLRVPTLVIVPTLHLQKDGVETALKLYPNLIVGSYSNADDKKLIKAGRDPMSAKNVDIMYCVINTARKKPPEFFQGFGLIILDEAHEYSAPSNATLLWKAQAPYLVGLSASPLEHESQLDWIVAKHLGMPLKLSEALGEDSDLVENYTFNGRVIEVMYKGEPDTIAEAADAAMSIVKTGIVIKDPHRLEMVAAYVEALLNLHETLPVSERAAWGLGKDVFGVVRRHSVLVFAEHRDYLPAIRDALLKRVDPADLYLMDPDEDSSQEAASAVVLRGGATDQDRIDALRFRVVLTTYGFCRRGVSLAHMTSTVLASSRRNGFTQILGRIGRLTPDQSLRTITRLVVDIRDTQTTLSSQASGRRPVYKAKGWPVYRYKHTFADFPLDKAAGVAFPKAGQQITTGKADEDDLVCDDDKVGDFNAAPPGESKYNFADFLRTQNGADAS